MFLVLTYGEYDQQSSRKAWEVWYPYRDKGFATRSAANEKILAEGCAGQKYHVVELGGPVKIMSPKPTLVPA